MSTHRIYPFIIFQFLSFFSLFLRQFEQISDVLFGERSRLIPRGKNISDLHIIIHLKRTRDDLRAIQFLANHAAADRVSVETYKQVEQGCPVPNNDFFSASGLFLPMNTWGSARNSGVNFSPFSCSAF